VREARQECPAYASVVLGLLARDEESGNFKGSENQDLKNPDIYFGSGCSDLKNPEFISPPDVRI